MRTFGIWIVGLLVSAIFGGLIDDRLYTGVSNDLGFFGILAGAFAFACVRLWLGQPRQIQIETLPQTPLIKHKRIAVRTQFIAHFAAQ